MHRVPGLENVTASRHAQIRAHPSGLGHWARLGRGAGSANLRPTIAPRQRSPSGPANRFKQPSTAAPPGDRVEVEPGVYRQTVAIDRDGVTLVGLNRSGQRAVLDGGGAASRCCAKLGR